MLTIANRRLLVCSWLLQTLGPIVDTWLVAVGVDVCVGRCVYTCFC